MHNVQEIPGMDMVVYMYNGHLTLQTGPTNISTVVLPKLIIILTV